MQQLSGLDMAFVALDCGDRPMHVGALLVFAPEQPVHPVRIARLLASRAAGIAALARSARMTWWPPAGAVWADDPGFAPGEHVQVHRLPPPYGAAGLAAWVADLMAQPLTSGRPPWQLHVVSGLGRDRFAVLAKLHHSLCDGDGMLGLLGSLLDDADDLVRGPGQPRRDAAPRGLLAQAVRLPLDVGRQAARAARLAAALAAAVRPLTLESPLTSTLSSSAGRQWASVRLVADDLRVIRKRLGGTMNDVALAILAGGLRSLLQQHGDAAALDGGWRARAFIPVSLRARRRARGGGNHLSGYLCELPVDEPDPIARARAVRTTMHHNRAAGPARGPGAFPLLAELLPGAVHRLLTPVLGRAAPLLLDTVVTTVPLPDVPLRLDRAPLQEIYPIAPLARGHALSVATATYHGNVHIGLLTDPALLPCALRLADSIATAASTLLEASHLPRLSRVPAPVPS